MAIGLGALASGYTGSMSDFYRMMIEQELQRRNQANQYDLSYQNWQKQQQFLQQQNAPLLQRQQAWQQLQEFEQTYPQQQILGNPALQSHWQQLRTQAGVPLATSPQATMQTVGPPTGTGPGLTAVGTQQPIGPLTQQPILPQRALQTKLVSVINEATGETRNITVPFNAEVRTFQPPAGGAKRTVLVDPTTGRVIQDYGPNVTVHLASAKGLPDPNQLTETERTLFGIFFDSARYAQIPKEAQAAFGIRIRDALRRVGVAVPDAPPPPQSDFWGDIKRWFQGTFSEAPSPPAGAPQRGLLPTGAAQPAVGAPPVTPGVPAPPARAIGAPPTAQTRTPAPTSRAQAVLGIWTQQKIPVPKVRWDSLTAVERAWLTSQGVTSGK